MSLVLKSTQAFILVNLLAVLNLSQQASATCSTTPSKVIEIAQSCPDEDGTGATLSGVEIQWGDLYGDTYIACYYDGSSSCTYSGAQDATGTLPFAYGDSSLDCEPDGIVMTDTPLPSPAPGSTRKRDTTYPGPLYDCPTAADSGETMNGILYDKGDYFSINSYSLMCSFDAANEPTCNYTADGDLDESTSSTSVSCPTKACPVAYDYSTGTKRSIAVLKNQVRAADLREGGKFAAKK